MGKKKVKTIYDLNCFLFFQSRAILVRIRLAMLHETKWFCRLVLFAVQLRKTPFLPSTKVSFWD
jgi:hypothetical protein